MHVYFTVDPGLGGTGVAVWPIDEWEKPYAPLCTRVLKCTKGDWVQRAKSISVDFNKMVHNYEPSKVWIEYPSYFESKHEAAVKGDILKLAFLIGKFSASCDTLALIGSCEFIPLPVNDWKGQLSKDTVAKRVANKLHCQPNLFPDHAMDAVGMGVYLKGFFNGTGSIRNTVNES
jgi:Holliday junction resolvasome RuvABC endonuclease subunit